MSCACWHDVDCDLVYQLDLEKAINTALQRRVEELERSEIRTCPPGVCKVQAPNPCICLVPINALTARLAACREALKEVPGHVKSMELVNIVDVLDGRREFNAQWLPKLLKAFAQEGER